MSSRTAVIQVEPDLAEAFNAAPKQQQERVKSIMRSVLKLVPPATDKSKGRKIKVPRLSKKETELFLRINRGLTEEQWSRMEELNEKIEESPITDEEHAELLRLAETAERLSVDRMRAIVQLAKLRKTPPEALMRQLEM